MLIQIKQPLNFLVKIAFTITIIIGNSIITLWIKMIFEKKITNNKYGVKIVRKGNANERSFQMNINNILNSNLLINILNYHHNDNNFVFNVI